jgi:hypothetical protein
MAETQAHAVLNHGEMQRILVKLAQETAVEIHEASRSRSASPTKPHHPSWPGTGEEWEEGEQGEGVQGTQQQPDYSWLVERDLSVEGRINWTRFLYMSVRAFPFFSFLE